MATSKKVTSTTGFQLDHLVPLDAISQCNALESLIGNGFTLLANTSELEASQTKHTQGQHIPKVLNLSQARAPPLFIAPKPNRAVGALEHIFVRSLDSNMRAPNIGWWCPTVELQWLFQTSHWDPGTGHRGAVHRPRDGGAPAAPKPRFHPSLKKYGGTRHQTVQ